MKAFRTTVTTSAIVVVGLLGACHDRSRTVRLVANEASLATASATVQTSSGWMRGIDAGNGVTAWLGIPYAHAPTGQLRWSPPQPNAWDHGYSVDRKLPECMQVLRAHDINHYFGEEATSEDCLGMNVWAPAEATQESALPVIVFIYGGGGTIGSSGMALYDGAAVAGRGAVFVNFNYRIGLLGFMAHPELTPEQGGRSGNYGYLDQRFAPCTDALEWPAWTPQTDSKVVLGDEFAIMRMNAQAHEFFSRNEPIISRAPVLPPQSVPRDGPVAGTAARNRHLCRTRCQYLSSLLSSCIPCSSA